MARRPLLEHNSSDRFRSDDDEQGSRYACDCGQEYMSEEALKQHQRKNCKNQSFICQFCQETFPSLPDYSDHLRLCGNKTDPCPNCRKFIRRSHFAYHYENDCAPIDEVETPPTRHKSRSTQGLPTNSNKPFSREDVPSNDYPENYSGKNPSMYPPRVNGRIQSPISTPRNSPVIIECEYCHNRCAQSDYKTHKNNCIRNPANINHRQPPPIPLRSNQKQNHNDSNDVARIPCEICNQPVDVSNWSNHIQDCREREKQRLQNRARSMSQEPVTEQLPCEYCQQLYSAQRLHSHEEHCSENPNNKNLKTKPVRPRPSTSATLPIKSKNNRSHPTSSGGRSPRNPRMVLYESIDVDRTHEANRSINSKGINQHPIRRTASDEINLHSENSSPDGHTYDNEPIRSNEHRSFQNISQRSRQRPPNDTSQRERSSFENLRNIQENQGPRNTAIGNHSPYYNDPRYRHHLHQGHGTLEVIDNQPGRPTMKKHKKSWIKKFFCGVDDGYSSG